MRKDNKMIQLNSEISASLKIGGTDAAPVWGDLGAAFKSIAQSMGESRYSAAYLADGGFSSSEVTGIDYSVTLSGDYMPSDPVVQYLFGREVLFGVGEARKTKLKIVKGETTVIWSVTMTKITENGGDANEPESITLELHGNGRPTVTQGSE